MDGPAGIVGVVTDRDICIVSASRRRLPESISAAQVMATPVHTCLAGDRPRDALATMKRFRVRRLAVIDQRGYLQGVVSMSDLVLVSAQTGEPDAKDILSTLAAICARRPAVSVAV